MAPLDYLLHWLNFVYPAFALGTLLAALGLVLERKVASARVFIAQAAINSIAGAVVLLAGLWFFGRDGKMATYAALVLVCATTQCWLRPPGARMRRRA